MRDDRELMNIGTAVNLDLLVKPGDPEGSIRVVLRDVRGCNGHGRLLLSQPDQAM
jgi:hypothetical protein